MPDPTPNPPTPNPLGNLFQPGGTPPTMEQIAAALHTLMQGLAHQPQQNIEYQSMVEQAANVDKLDEQIKKLQEEKKQVCATLIPLLHKLAGGHLTLAGGHEILACISQDKRPRKKQIVTFFVTEFGEVEGKKKAEAFWKSVPSKTREYISVRRPGEVPAGPDEEEDAEDPAPAAPGTAT